MKPQWLLSISSSYFLGRFQSSSETTGEKLIRKWPRARLFLLHPSSDLWSRGERDSCSSAAMLLEGLFHVAHLWPGRSQWREKWPLVKIWPLILITLQNIQCFFFFREAQTRVFVRSWCCYHSHTVLQRHIHKLEFLSRAICLCKIFTFILGGQFLLPQRANSGEVEIIQPQNWMTQRRFGAWGIQTGPFTVY